MADRKISDLTALTTPAAGDYLPIVDISEVAASSKNKRITIEELLRGAPDGTAAAPSIGFESDPNTGIYRPGADQVAISTAGSGRLFVDASGILTHDGAQASFKNGTGVSNLALFGRNTDGRAELTFRDNTGASNNSRLVGTSTFLSVETAGTERLRITSAGLVGIGTSSPGARLDIARENNQLYISCNLGVPSFTYAERARTLQLSCSQLSTSPFTSFSDIVANSSQFNENILRFFTHSNDGTSAPLERLRIDGSGRVGIGTTSPASTLEVNGDTGLIVHPTTASTTAQIQIAGTRVSGAAPVAVVNLKAIPENPAGDSDASSFAIETRASGGVTSERARIDSSGRLLVGTSSAPTTTASRLTLQGNSTNAAFGANVNMQCGATNPTVNYDLGTFFFGDGNSSLGASISALTDGAWGTNDYPGRLVFSTTADGASSPTERLRITNAGDLSMADGRQIFVFGNGDAPRGKIVAQNTANNTTATVVEFRGWDNSVTGTITTRVNVTAYNTSSDYRLKENITDLVDATSRVKLLKPKRFNFKANPDETLDGFLAHEAQIAVPEAVSGQKDQVDNEGNPVHQGVDLGKFVPLLTAALQEAIGRIETLEAEVAALKAS